MSNLFDQFNKSGDGEGKRNYAVWPIDRYMESDCTAIQFAQFHNKFRDNDLQSYFRMLFSSINEDGEVIRKWTEWMTLCNPTNERSKVYKLFKGAKSYLENMSDNDFVFNKRYNVFVETSPKNPKYSNITGIKVLDKESDGERAFFDVAGYPPFRKVRNFNEYADIDSMWVRLEDGTAHLVEEAEFREPEDDNIKG